MAVTKVGSHPVLPRAADLMERHGLQFEYGTGMHAQPLPGMRATTTQQH